MSVVIAANLLFALAVYCLIGLVFGLAFVTVGARRIDASATGAAKRLRLMWLPGAIALWPVLLIKWAGAGKEDAA